MSLSNSGSRRPRRCDAGSCRPGSIAGLVTGPTTEELAEIKALRREVADQQRTIEILKAATTYFAQEADPRPR